MDHDASAGRLMARVQQIERLNADTVGVRLACPGIGTYEAGQYLRVHVDAQTIRYYSLASVPALDRHLELHVRKGAPGSASRWFHEVLRPDDMLEIEAPQGDSIYDPEAADSPLLLLSTGSGLAPHVGILRTALHQSHSNTIYLYHGVRHRHELYLVEALRNLARRHANFRYVPCLSGADQPLGYTAGRALDAALRDLDIGQQWRVYLSGNSAMVASGCRAALAAGVPFEQIFSDQLPRSLEAFAALAA